MAGVNCTYYLNGKKMTYGEFRDEISSNPIHIEKYKLGSSSIPNNPLLKNWQELSVKRALKEAVDNNSDYLAWISGEQTSARYNLATHVENVKWEKGGINNAERTINITPLDDKGVIRVRINKEGVIEGGANTNRDWQGKKLDEVLGKGLADKIMEKESGTLSGEGLKFGGEWAKNLYDKQIKNIVEDVTGGKVETLDMGLPIDAKTEKVFQFSTNSGASVTLTPQNAKVGMSVSKGVENWIITEAPKNGKVKMVPEMVEHAGEQHFYPDMPSDWKKSVRQTQEETFDISTKKSAGQQAIKITPEIRALVKGDSPLLKKPSGKLPLLHKSNQIK